MEKVYILLCDGDGTMRSIDEPFGVAVKSKEEAEKFLEVNYGYTRSYQEVKIYDNFNEYLKEMRK